MDNLAEKRERLLAYIGQFKDCAVAFSAGIDSTVVAQAAQLVLGDSAVAVTGSSASLPAGELEQAVELARRIGIRHEIIATDEFSKPDYLRNADDRCYHCKTELYSQIERLAARLGTSVIFNGANVDDLGDYRPGMQAAREYRVASPLADCGFTKSEVRELAQAWNLPIWDKPASPCLSSRVAYGEAVTPERLAMIDAAEQTLRELGLRTVRVRFHKGDMARLEVPTDALARLCAEEVRRPLVERLKALGFKYVTLDLEGFRSGSLNALVSLERLTVR